jgi:hypothetical protein
VLLNEELDDGLEQMLDADLAVLFNESKETLLILVPVLNRVSFLVEDTTHQEIVFIVTSEVHRDL